MWQTSYSQLSHSVSQIMGHIQNNQKTAVKMSPQLPCKENKISATVLRRPKPLKSGVTGNSSTHFKDKMKGGLSQKYLSSNWANRPPENFEKLIPSHFIQLTYFSFIICYSNLHNHLIF